MTRSVIPISAISLGVVALVSFSHLSTARADTSAPSETTSATSGATSAPASETPTVQPPSRPYVPHYAHHYARHTHYAWRNGHRHVDYRYRHNPVAAGATAVAGGLADLGSIATYPIYCFPNYGSCPVYRPY